MRKITVGAAVGVFGIKGYIRVKSLVSDDKIFRQMTTVDIINRAGQTAVYEVEDSKPHKGMWLVKLAGVDTPEDAMVFRGSKFIASEEFLHKPQGNEVYWIHIQGFLVVDNEGNSVGKLIDYAETGIHDVFIIDGDDGKEYIISNNPNHVLEIDVENKRVVVDPLGLVDQC